MSDEPIKVCAGNTFMLAVRKALGITSLGQRLIIDAKAGGVVTVYLQLVGDERLLSLDLVTLLQGADVRVVGINVVQPPPPAAAQPE